MQVYSDEEMEDDPYSLPDVEVFFHQHVERELCALNAGRKEELYGACILDSDGDCLGTGWYYWYCFPGCLPDSEPFGPFKSEEEAIEGARENS